MRKGLLIIVLLLFLSACGGRLPADKEISLEDFIETIEIPKSTINNIELAETYIVNNEIVFAIWETSNRNSISTSGKVTQDIYDIKVTLSLLLSSSKGDAEKTFVVTVPGYGVEKLLTDALATIVIPNSTKENIELPYALSYLSKRLEISWDSSNNSVLNGAGRVRPQENDTLVTLTALIIFDGVEVTRDFNVIVKGLTAQEKLDTVFDEATPPAYITSDIILPTEFSFSLTGVWESSHPEVLSNEGKLSSDLVGTYEVVLTLTLNSNDRRTYEVIVTKSNHMVIDQAFTGKKENVVIDNKDLVLVDGAVVGEYNTGIINTLEFDSLVASWAAVSSKTATVELQIQVLVGSTWSKYFSYGEWGQGLQNKSTNSSDSIAKFDVDILDISAGKKAQAIRIKLILKRTNANVDSPRVMLIAAALNIPGYIYPVDISSLPKEVDYDVPQLYQHEVPTIGNSICSPTSSTMLLKYKGHNFKQFDTYEHRYIANLLKDYGNNIFGNWVYNTVGISSFGEVSYVKRMYSYEEMLYHLATVGPISASIKGNFIGQLGPSNYTTNGHLIVVRGYRWDGDQLYIIVNDPNLRRVYEEMKVNDFMKVWRNIAYVIE